MPTIATTYSHNVSDLLYPDEQPPNPITIILVIITIAIGLYFTKAHFHQ